MPEIQRADPRARRQALGWLAAGLVLGLVLLAAVQRHEAELVAWLERNLRTLDALTVLLVGAVLIAPLIAFCVYLWLYGHRIASSGRLPPPGQPVVRDTRVVEGGQAILIARCLQAMALVLGLLSSCLPLILLEIVDSMRQ